VLGSLIASETQNLTGPAALVTSHALPTLKIK